MLQIAIIEDEADLAQQTKDNVVRYLNEHGLEGNIAVFNDGIPLLIALVRKSALSRFRTGCISRLRLSMLASSRCACFTLSAAARMLSVGKSRILCRLNMEEQNGVLESICSQTP